MSIRTHCARFSACDLGVSVVVSYELIFPDYLDDYEHETESKGYLVGVKVLIDGASIELAIYDQARLRQEVNDEIEASGFFSEARLVVVSRVTRDEISRAIDRLSAGGFRGLL
jgi:hypothetical protein